MWAELVFSQESARQILSDLVVSIWQKCYVEDIAHPFLQEAGARGHSAPHESEHCEACQLGVHWGMQRGHQGCRGRSPETWPPPGEVGCQW